MPITAIVAAAICFATAAACIVVPLALRWREGRMP